jgi:hypothetical protein
MRTLAANLMVVSILGIGSGTLVVGALHGRPTQPPAQSLQQDNNSQAPARAKHGRHESESLPTLLQKALLAVERTEVASLERLHEVALTLREGGDVATVQVEDAEAALLELRISALRREGRYQDSLDQLRARFGVSPEALQKTEETRLLPLTRHLQEYQGADQKMQELAGKLSRQHALENEKNLRSDARRVMESPAFAQGTRFGTQLPDLWAALEKLPDEAIRKQLTEQHEKRRQLLDKQTDLELKGQSVTPADQERLEEINQRIHLADFESLLRQYESLRRNLHGQKQQQERPAVARFYEVYSAFVELLVDTRSQRLNSLGQNWPKLPSVEQPLVRFDRQTSSAASARGGRKARGYGKRSSELAQCRAFLDTSQGTDPYDVG